MILSATQDDGSRGDPRLHCRLMKLPCAIASFHKRRAVPRSTRGLRCNGSVGVRRLARCVFDSFLTLSEIGSHLKWNVSFWWKTERHAAAAEIKRDLSLLRGSLKNFDFQSNFSRRKSVQASSGARSAWHSAN